MKLLSKEISQSKNFLNLGYYNFIDTIDPLECKKFEEYLSKNYKISKNVFLSEKKYLFEKKEKIEHAPHNVLDSYDDSFIFSNPSFLRQMKLILGNNFKLYAKKVICSIPSNLYPKWINKYQPNCIPNLTDYLKPHYRGLRFFYGADFHQDLMDHPGHKANFLTVYIYLGKVNKSMSPLMLLPKTHLSGPEKYPHDLKFNKNSIVLNSRNKTKIKTEKIIVTGSSGTTWGWHTCLLHGTIPNNDVTPRYSIRLTFRQNKDSNCLMNAVNKKLPKLTTPRIMF